MIWKDAFHNMGIILFLTPVIVSSRNLSYNQFNGSVKPASHLKELDLSYNEFTGPLPDLSLCSASIHGL